MPRTQIFLVALVCAALSACERSPTGIQRTGSAEITLTTAAGVRQFRGAAAGTYAYSPGPTPDTRALFLTLTAGDTADLGIEIELFLRLPSNQDLPTPGTYVFNAAGEPVDVAYGSNLIWMGGRVKQYVAFGSPSTLTIETTTPEVVTGRFTMEATELHATERVTVASVFSAERVGRFEDLPRQR